MSHAGACCVPLLALLLGCAIPAADRADVVEPLDRAEFVLDDAEDPPPAGAARTRVSLPDRWRERRPEQGGIAWYRLRLANPEAASEIWAVFLPHVNMSAAVWVNGVPVGAGGRLREPVSHDFNRPLYVSFPSALLDRPVDTIDIRLFAYAHHYGELGPVWVGPDAALRPRFERQLLLRITLAEIATALCIAVLVFSCALWIGTGFEPVYGWLAVVTAFWSIASLNYWLQDLPVSHWTWERLIHPALDGFMLSLAIWAHRYLDVRRPRLERVLFAAGGLSLLLAWTLPVPRFYPAVNVMHALCFPAAVYGGTLVLWRRRHAQPAEAVIFLVCGVLAFGLALHDLGVQFGLARAGSPFLLIYLVPVLLAAFGSTLVIRFATALRASEALGRELEQRVHDKSRALEQSFDERRALERAQLLSEERERLVREMHDGLGGQLVALLSMAEGEAGADSRLASSVRGALQDMRLVIHSLDPGLQDLTAALGAARARLEPLLVRRGVRLEWRIEDLPATPWLGPTEYLQVLRLLQESLANAAQHADAHSVVVRAGRCARDGVPGLVLEVRDDGRGLEGTAASGRGMHNLHARALRLGGTLRIAPAYPGTRVELWIPCPELPPEPTGPA